MVFFCVFYFKFWIKRTHVGSRGYGVLTVLKIYLSAQTIHLSVDSLLLFFIIKASLYLTSTYVAWQSLK